MAGSLPPGLTLGATGTINGRPTTLGSYTFTVRVRDSQPNPAETTKPFTIVVNR
jgi:hypothetical protein